MEKSHITRISLKLKTDLFSPIENQKKITEDFIQKGSLDQVIEEETPQSLAETKEKNHQTKQEPGEKLLLNKMIPAEKVEEEPLREDKKISMENNQPNKNRKAKAETEKSLTTRNKETEKEVEQEKEGNLPSQNKNNDLKEKPVQEEPHVASQEADNKDEDQGEKNLEIEEALDFTGNDYLDNVNPPELLEFQRPVYPKNLRERDIEGKVIIKLLIDKEGKVQEIQIFESSGYKMFDEIAIKTVRQWRFKPARKGNQQRGSWVLIPINFQIK